VRVDEHTTTIDHVPVFYRSAGIGSVAAETGSVAAETGSVAAETGSVVYLHDAITSSDDWTAFLERSGGIAPDLIGFGRSGKGGHLDYSPEGLTNFVLRLLAELEVDRVKLVGHGWGGALALLAALKEPERVERIVLIDAVPLLPGFAWHGPARWWRRPVIGELIMGSISKRQLRRQLRKGSAAWTNEQLDAIWEQFDQGTQRALLRLHRAADERELAAFEPRLRAMTAQTLVVWGEHDPWFSAKFAEAYVSALPRATLERIPEAGHWPWLDQPRVIESVARFLASE
jgi:pimeloyl-ACP methyl ester carboxylesterase